MKLVHRLIPNNSLSGEELICNQKHFFQFFSSDYKNGDVRYVFWVELVCKNYKNYGSLSLSPCFPNLVNTAFHVLIEGIPLYW